LTAEPGELKQLGDWVDWLQDRSASSGDWLRLCWWRHSFVVEELAALRTAWLDVYQSNEAATLTAAITWNVAPERCWECASYAIGTGPHCNAVAYEPDQSVSDDPR
jgi:hypothetical protein